MKTFMAMSNEGPVDDDRAGVGRNIFEALLLEPWQKMVTSESLMALIPRVMGYWKDELGADGKELVKILPEELVPLAEFAPPLERHGILCNTFEYTVPGLPPTKVEFLLARGRDRDGSLQGAICVNQVGVRPTLVSLLARGDERMYERMAALQEPRRCQGAIRHGRGTSLGGLHLHGSIGARRTTGRDGPG
jgi:hypothetical protein